MIKKLGTFLTSSDVLRITDPCYDKGVWCSGTVKNCKIGEWSAFLIYRDEGDWGVRVAENIAMFGEVSIEQAQKIIDESIWINSNISVGVDSGQCGIFDDSKYPDGDDTGEYGDDNSFYGKCCNYTLGEENGGVLDFGIVSSSGYGDGSYDCFISKGNDKISIVRIIFLDEIDKNLSQDDE